MAILEQWFEFARSIFYARVRQNRSIAVCALGLLVLFGGDVFLLETKAEEARKLDANQIISPFDTSIAPPQFASRGNVRMLKPAPSVKPSTGKESAQYDDTASGDSSWANMARAPIAGIHEGIGDTDATPRRTHQRNRQSKQPNLPSRRQLSRIPAPLLRLPQRALRLPHLSRSRLHWIPRSERRSHP